MDRTLNPPRLPNLDLGAEIRAILLLLAAVITHGGKAIVTARLMGLGTEPKFIGWGTGAGVAAATDTDLFVPGTEARVNGTSSRITTNVPNDTHLVVGLLTADANKTITNVGLFEALAAGTLFGKSDFPGIPLNGGDGVQWTLKTVVS